MPRSAKVQGHTMRFPNFKVSNETRRNATCAFCGSFNLLTFVNSLCAWEMVTYYLGTLMDNHQYPQLC